MTKATNEVRSASRLISIDEVASLIGYSRASIYRLVDQGRLPKPVKVGERAVRFIESEIEEVISKAAAARG